MDSVAIEFLSQLEKQQRARQIEALQMLNQAQVGRPRRVALYKRLGSGLARLLVCGGRRLEAWSVSAERPAHGQA